MPATFEKNKIGQFMLSVTSEAEFELKDYIIE